MATYGYKAITKAGKEVKGSLEADNKDLVLVVLCWCCVLFFL